MAEGNNFKYKYPGYLANNETITSAKLNSIITAINTLIENLMNHDHIGVTDSYNQTTRGPKLIGDACLVEKTITTRCLNDYAVTTEKIKDYNITTIKLSSKENNGTAAVGRNNIKDNAIGTNEIENKRVTREKLDDGVIDFSKIDTTTLNSIYDTMFNMMYPIGSTYITTLSYCPLQKGRWELITTAQSRVLQVASSPDKAGTTIEAGLPNITGSIGDFNGNCNSGTRLGVFKQSYNSNYKYTNSSGSNRHQFIVFNANDGATVKGIYKDDCKTVQPPAFLINIFKRVE